MCVHIRLYEYAHILHVCMHLPLMGAVLSLANRGSRHPTNQLANNDDKVDEQNDDNQSGFDMFLHQQ